MAKFFISYSRKDLPIAEKLRDHLQMLDRSNDVFLDVHRIKTGAKWKESLYIAVRESAFFILLLSGNSTTSRYVREEVRWVLREELKSGVRKLFVVRTDKVMIPNFLAAFQVLSLTNNFTIDFYKLMEGINGKATFYRIQHERESDPENGYWIKLFVEAPAVFLRLIERVEYRFDYEFHWSKYVDAVEVVDKGRGVIQKKFAVEFWTNEPILVYVVLYLKPMRQIAIEHHVPLYD